MSELPELCHLISLKGKRALVTGAATGIGQAIALRLAEAGADLDLVDVDAEGLAKASADLGKLRANIRQHVVDISSKDEMDKLWQDLEGSEPEILINNAGIYPFKDFLDVDEALYRKTMAINLDAVFWMCQHMIRARKKQGGVIINIGSIEAVIPFKDDLAHYSVSKAGVIALTRALAKEHGKHGFRVNAIVPGGIITHGTREAAKGVMHMHLDLVKTGIEFKQRLPIGRLGQPDEVARMTVVLASELSSYVHGAVIPVDGGFLSA